MHHQAVEDFRFEMEVLVTVDIPWRILVGLRKLKEILQKHNSSLQETVIAVQQIARIVMRK